MNKSKRRIFLVAAVAVLVLSSCQTEKQINRESEENTTAASALPEENWTGTYQYEDLICPGKEFIVGPTVLDYESSRYKDAVYQVTEQETCFYCEARAEEDGFVDGCLNLGGDYKETILDEEMAEKLDLWFLKFQDTELNKLEKDFEDFEEARDIFSDPDFIFSMKDFVGARIRLQPAKAQSNRYFECWIDAGEGVVYIVSQTDVTMWIKDSEG